MRSPGELIPPTSGQEPNPITLHSELLGPVAHTVHQKSYNNSQLYVLLVMKSLSGSRPLNSGQVLRLV
jgi:hypothetical protein